MVAAGVEESFVDEAEYSAYFARLNGLRAHIAEDLKLEPGMSVLDLACGYGFFTAQTAFRHPEVSLVGIDLASTDVDEATKRASKQGLADRIQFIRMDSTRLDFPDHSFDAVINFLGLEDIHMTRGREGIYRTFREVNRILRANGCFCFTVMPPEEMETEAQRLEVAVFEYCCNCRWLSTADYTSLLQSGGFAFPIKSSYRTGRKLTTEQAREEIRFACDNVPDIYGVPARSFEEVWAKYGPGIEKHGLGHYSKVLLFQSQKIYEAMLP